jgi:hypothetical protein
VLQPAVRTYALMTAHYDTTVETRSGRIGSRQGQGESGGGDPRHHIAKLRNRQFYSKAAVGEPVARPTIARRSIS